MREFIINQNDAGQRVDKFLTKAVPKLPKNLLYKYLRLKRIKLNGKRCEISTRLSCGDVMQLYINDEFFEGEVADRPAFLSAPTSLNIIYEDENIILCDKKCGLVVHEDESGSTDTLINRIQHYLYEKGEYRPEEELSFAPALCNRIDRNTGGIVIAAKNAEALRIMNEKIRNDELSKFYLAAVHGHMPKRADTLHGYLRKDQVNNIVDISTVKKPGYKEIVTKYRVLDEKNSLSLIEVELVTGRTHQIRAHFSSIGHPLLGDGKYGVNRDDKKLGYKFQALYAYRLEFRFRTDSGALAYLNGKSFSIDKSKVWFLGEFE